MVAKKYSFRVQFVSSSLSIMLLLLLLGIVVFCTLSASTLAEYVKENIGVSVILSDDMNKGEIRDFEQHLMAKDYVKETVFVSKEDALKEQKEAMGTDPAEFLGFNPFSASLEIKLRAQYANMDSLEWIQRDISRNKKVLEVSYPHELITAVNRNINRISVVLLIVASVLALISFALINNTIHLVIYSKRFLIHTMKLVGASWSFIRWPLIRKALKIGILAAVLADVVLCVVFYLLIRYEPQLTAIITMRNTLVVMVSVLVCGILLSVLCSYISMNKYLRMRVDELYYV